MSILIANIGTSDLSIQVAIDGVNYYLPIDPLRETNLFPNNPEQLSEEQKNEKNKWYEPYQYFKSSGLYAELGFNSDVTATSRELTEKLFEQYKKKSTLWHSRIQLPRIMGVIKKAMSMGISQGYIFVSNQKSKEFPNGHPKDTVFLYEILKLYLEIAKIEFDLIPEPIPGNIPLNDADLLFNYYFDIFNKIRTKKECNRRHARFPQINENVLCTIIGFQTYANGEGILVETEECVKGFINISNISQKAMNVKQLNKTFKVNDKIWAKLIKRDGEKLKFSTKEFENIPGEILTNYEEVFARVNEEVSLNLAKQDAEEVMLISVKGGTPQMKTALQLQAISVSAINRLLFVNPELVVSNVFSGIPSECELESYWRYMRTQKYQTVRILLERWDFDGAIQVLENWQDYLNYLTTQEINRKDEVAKSNEFSKLIDTALLFSRACCNLDFQTAKNIAQQGIKTASGYPKEIQNTFSKLNDYANEYRNHSQYRLLNIYTLNRINWQLDQNAMFLTLLSSFCEEVLHGLILEWDGNADYWKYTPKSGKFEINVNKLKHRRPSMWEDFVRLQKQNKYNKNFGDQDIYSYKLENRYNKRNFFDAIVRYYNVNQDIQAWNQLSIILKQLDFWIDKRNDLIHSATGLSQMLMQELYNTYTPEEGEFQPCQPNEILPLMAEMIKNKLVNLNTDYADKYIGAEADYYIYSFVRDWVVRQLIDDGLS